MSHSAQVITDDDGNIVGVHARPAPFTGETRTFINPEITGFDEGSGIIEATAVTYGVTDTYNTRFLPGCFNAWLRRDLDKGVVPLVWSHNHERRVGKLVDFKDLPDKLVVVAQLDDPARAHPERAQWIRKAWEGVRRRILDEFSVMVVRDDYRTAPDGVGEFVKARMVHLGLVLEGAVPGAVLLGVRQPGPRIPALSPMLELAATVSGRGEPSPPAPRAPEIAYYARMDAAYRAAGLDPTQAPDRHHDAIDEADRALAALQRTLGR